MVRSLFVKKMTFESRGKKRKEKKPVSCHFVPAVCITDVIKKAGLCGKSIQIRHEPTLSALQW